MIVITLSNPIIMQLYWSAASKESRPSNLLSALRACRKQQFPNVHTIFHIMTVWPLTSCEAERSISGLRRLKTYLRSTMMGERMNGLALLAVHRCISVSVKETIDAFASKQPRRMKLSFILEDEATDATDE